MNKQVIGIFIYEKQFILVSLINKNIPLLHESNSAAIY